MRRKILQDLANTLPQMLVGWRMGDDAAAFARLGSGQLTVDVNAGKATFNQQPVELWIAGELRAWFFERLEKSHLNPAHLQTTMIADLVATPVPGKRKRGTTFDWDITCNIQTDEITYVGKKKESHTWAGVVSQADGIA